MKDEYREQARAYIEEHGYVGGRWLMQHLEQELALMSRRPRASIEGLRHALAVMAEHEPAVGLSATRLEVSTIFARTRPMTRTVHTYEETASHHWKHEADRFPSMTCVRMYLWAQGDV